MSGRPFLLPYPWLLAAALSAALVLAVPVSAGVLSMHQGRIPISVHWDADTTVASQALALEQFMHETIRLGAGRPGYNTDVRNMLGRWTKAHEARLDPLVAWLRERGIEPEPVPARVLGLSGAANSAEAMDACVEMQAELVQLYTDLLETATDDSLIGMLTANRLEAGYMCKEAADWLGIAPPKHVRTLLEEAAKAKAQGSS